MVKNERERKKFGSKKAKAKPHSPNNFRLGEHNILDDDCLDEVDLEDLLAVLSPAEVQALVDEMAADPDDVHIPASVRYMKWPPTPTAYISHPPSGT